MPVTETIFDMQKAEDMPGKKSWLFRREVGLPAYRIIIWWEIRRIPFNIMLLSIGTVSVLVYLVGFGILDRDYYGGECAKDIDCGDLIGFSTALYILAANLCYTFGWVVEIVLKYLRGGETSTFAPTSLRRGMIFSALLTILPAVINWVTLALKWALS